MSSAFQVSALNVVMGQTEGMKTRSMLPGEDYVGDLLTKFTGQEVQVVTNPGRYVPYRVTDVTKWREQVATKYRAQLDEELSWDENSSFVASEDFAGSVHQSLLYVAARVDTQGDAVARNLIRIRKPHHTTAWSVIDQAAKRGFGGRFPQLLLGVQYWLPFRRNMIIEEPDPRGSMTRFGSLLALAQELEDVRNVIARADQKAALWTSPQDMVLPDVVVAAWQGSDLMQRMCSIALTHRLPMFIFG